MKRIKLWIVLLSLGATALWAEKPVDRTVPADPNGSVEIEIISGSVKVNGWGSAEVQVTGTLGDDVQELEVREEGGHIEIDLKIPKNNHGRNLKIKADLEIWVPAGAEVSVETVSAPIQANGLSGLLELSSVSGSINAEGSPSRVELETVSGTIHWKGSDTEVSAESVSGSIHLEGAARVVEVSAVSGEIKVFGENLDRVAMEAVSGSLLLEGSLSSQARLDASVHSGIITLALPADTAASLRVETFSGELINDFGPEAERSGQYAPGKSLDFSTGSGGAEVKVESFSGKVHLKKQ